MWAPKCLQKACLQKACPQKVSPLKGVVFIKCLQEACLQKADLFSLIPVLPVQAALTAVTLLPVQSSPSSQLLFWLPGDVQLWARSLGRGLGCGQLSGSLLSLAPPALVSPSGPKIT